MMVNSRLFVLKNKFNWTYDLLFAKVKITLNLNIVMLINVQKLNPYSVTNCGLKYNNKINFIHSVKANFKKKFKKNNF